MIKGRTETATGRGSRGLRHVWTFDAPNQGANNQMLRNSNFQVFRKHLLWSLFNTVSSSPRRESGEAGDGLLNQIYTWDVPDDPAKMTFDLPKSA